MNTNKDTTMNTQTTQPLKHHGDKLAQPPAPEVAKDDAKEKPQPPKRHRLITKEAEFDCLPDNPLVYGANADSPDWELSIYEKGGKVCQLNRMSHSYAVPIHPDDADKPEPFIHPGSFDPIAPTDKDSLTVEEKPFDPAPAAQADEGKSLGQVCYEANNPVIEWEHLSQALKNTWNLRAKAVAAEVLRLHAEEVERLKGELEAVTQSLYVMESKAKCAEADLHNIGVVAKWYGWHEKHPSDLETFLRIHMQTLKENAEDKSKWVDRHIASKARAESAEKRVEELEECIKEIRPSEPEMRITNGDLRAMRDLVLERQAALTRISDLERELKERTATDHLVDANDTEPAWIEHDGGECPLRDEEVEEFEVRYRNGLVYTRTSKPSCGDWTHTQEGSDITHFRVHRWKPGYTATTITGPDGKVYMRHKPGDPQPIADDVMVYCLGDTVSKGARKAKDLYWEAHTYAGIIGWRYADAELKAKTVPLEQPEPFNESKWIWMAEWCRNQAYDHCNPAFWRMAEEQYNASHNTPN